MIWLLSLLSLLTKKTKYHCLWYDTEVITSMDIKFKFLKRGYILDFKYTINHFLLSQGGSSSFLQSFQKQYTSEFWRISCNCSMMKRFVRAEHRILLFFSLSLIMWSLIGDSSWSSFNIFFKNLRYTSSENSVGC